MLCHAGPLHAGPLPGSISSCGHVKQLGRLAPSLSQVCLVRRSRLAPHAVAIAKLTFWREGGGSWLCLSLYPEQPNGAVRSPTEAISYFSVDPLLCTVPYAGQTLRQRAVVLDCCPHWPFPYQKRPPASWSVLPPVLLSQLLMPKFPQEQYNAFPVAGEMQQEQLCASEASQVWNGC